MSDDECGVAKATTNGRFRTTGGNGDDDLVHGAGRDDDDDTRSGEKGGGAIVVAARSLLPPPAVKSPTGVVVFLTEGKEEDAHKETDDDETTVAEPEVDEDDDKESRSTRESSRSSTTSPANSRSPSTVRTLRTVLSLPKSTSPSPLGSSASLGRRQKGAVHHRRPHPHQRSSPRALQRLGVARAAPNERLAIDENEDNGTGANVRRFSTRSSALLRGDLKGQEEDDDDDDEGQVLDKSGGEGMASLAVQHGSTSADATPPNVRRLLMKRIADELRMPPGDDDLNVLLMGVRPSLGNPFLVGDGTEETTSPAVPRPTKRVRREEYGDPARDQGAESGHGTTSRDNSSAPSNDVVATNTTNTSNDGMLTRASPRNVTGQPEIGPEDREADKADDKPPDADSPLSGVIRVLHGIRDDRTRSENDKAALLRRVAELEGENGRLRTQLNDATGLLPPLQARLAETEDALATTASDLEAAVQEIDHIKEDHAETLQFLAHRVERMVIAYRNAIFWQRAVTADEVHLAEAERRRNDAAGRLFRSQGGLARWQGVAEDAGFEVGNALRDALQRLHDDDDDNDSIPQYDFHEDDSLHDAEGLDHGTAGTN